MPVDKELLDEEILRAKNEIRTDRFDISYGEIANFYEDKELVIRPEYQRLFRWSPTQKSRFIESILLGFPTPAIFVAEDEHGVWELVDGLQRISTVLEFMGILKDAHDDPVTPSTLIRARRNPTLPSLKDATYKDLSLQARLAIKRAACRVEVIKTGSNQTVKYDVFERLNTGGSELSPQEVRDCIFRDIDHDFIEVVDELARFGPFCDHLHLSEHQEKTLFDRGLVLRHFTMKNAYREFEHDVEPFITDYVRAILEQEHHFDVPEEQTLFEETFSLIADAMEGDSWRHIRNGRHTGPFSVHVFDTVSVGVALNVERINQLSAAALRLRIEEFKQAKEFLDNTGADIRPCVLGRMDFACEFFSR